jgi:methionyl-tRNA synthetase
MISFVSSLRVQRSIITSASRPLQIRAPHRLRCKNVTPTNERGTFCITTPIYYVNGQPHLGHAYTSILSDVIARYQRKLGKRVFFLTGTDEHGQKVEQSASNANKLPIDFADEVSATFRELFQKAGCSNDDFIRTTEERHKQGVIELWKRLERNGQIYLGAYEGWYSIRDEAFYAESELVDGKAPTGAEVQWVKEESFFFRLSEWTQPLLRFYEENPCFIAPKGRRNEVISFVGQEGGLKDLSISRTTFSWGIPVPCNDRHVVYVWLDALTNYISALGFPNEEGKFAEFWPADLHIVGKDILRFHAVFWPAFLMAAGLQPPKVCIKTSLLCVFLFIQALVHRECLLMDGGPKVVRRCPNPLAMCLTPLNSSKHME